MQVEFFEDDEKHWVAIKHLMSCLTHKEVQDVMSYFQGPCMVIRYWIWVELWICSETLFLSAYPWVKELLLPSPLPHSSISEFAPHTESEWLMVAGNFQWNEIGTQESISESCGKEGKCQKVSLKCIWYVHPWLLTPSYLFVHTHTETHIHARTVLSGKGTFERGQHWKLHASIGWTFSF